MDILKNQDVGMDAVVQGMLQDTVPEVFKEIDMLIDNGKDNVLADIEELTGGNDTGPDSGNDSRDDVTNDAQSIGEVNDWIKEINPKYDSYDANPDYENNCGCCAYAVSQRLDGRTDVYAGPDNIGTNEGMEGITGHSIVKSSPEEIELTLQDAGPGSHVIVGIDRLIGPGHWFNAYCADDGRVYYVDGQTGETGDWPPKDLGFVIRWEIENKYGNSAD